MRPRNLDELRSAIERNEVLYLTVQDQSLKRQIWQTLIYLRESLKSGKRSRRR